MSRLAASRSRRRHHFPRPHPHRPEMIAENTAYLGAVPGSCSASSSSSSCFSFSSLLASARQGLVAATVQATRCEICGSCGALLLAGRDHPARARRRGSNRELPWTSGPLPARPRHPDRPHPHPDRPALARRPLQCLSLRRWMRAGLPPAPGWTHLARGCAQPQAAGADGASHRAACRATRALARQPPRGCTRPLRRPRRAPSRCGSRSQSPAACGSLRNSASA